MEETLKLILNEIRDLKSGQRRLEQRIDSFESSQNERFENLSSDVKVLKNNLIDGLGPYFEQIEKHIDTKTAEIKETLEDQQRVIDTLSARSIKHESEIKDFKHILKNQ